MAMADSSEFVVRTTQNAQDLAPRLASKILKPKSNCNAALRFSGAYKSVRIDRM